MGSKGQRILQLLLSPSEYSSINYGTMSDDEIVKMDVAAPPSRLSVARRFFVLLTIFDFLFTTLLWIICTVTSRYTSLASAFENEVIHYNIKTSVFDVVIVASIRAFLILLFYAMLRISHWWVISITTAGSGIFIVAKVLLYDWGKVASSTASVVLILYSFVISWVEAWFLDCRVVPSEIKQFQFSAEDDPERAPIVPHAALSRSQSDDGSAFYSPPGSDDEEAEKERDGSAISEVEWLSPKNSGENPSDEDYRVLAEDTMTLALNIVQSDGWVKEKVQGDDVVYSKNIPPYGKVFKFVGPINSTGDKIIDEIYYKAQDLHKWNPTVNKVQVIKKVDDHIDVTHVIANEAASGMVSSRDFVNVRIWKKQEGKYIHALSSTTHPDFPVFSKYVRGEQGPSVYVITPVTSETNASVMQWTLNTNLKGWLPQYLVDQTLVTVMLEYVQSLRKQMSTRQELT